MKRIFAFILIAILLTSCSAKSGAPNEDYSVNFDEKGGTAPQQDNSMNYGANAATAPQAAESEAYDMDTAEMAKENPTSLVNGRTDITGGSNENANRKVIINSNVEMESKKFDDEVEFIKTQVINSGGYIENSQLSKNLRGDNESKYITMVLKIPVDKYENVKNQILSVGNVVSLNESQEDKTAEYMDSQSKLRLKKEEEKSLVGFLEKAQTIEEVLELEQRIGAVRQEIETTQAHIDNIDRLAAFSTMHINIFETLDYTVKIADDGSFGEEIKETFTASLNFTIAFFEGVAIFISGGILPVSIIGLFILIIYRIYRQFRPKKT